MSLSSYKGRGLLGSAVLLCLVLVPCHARKGTSPTPLPFSASCDVNGSIVINGTKVPQNKIISLVFANNTKSCKPAKKGDIVAYDTECQVKGVLTLALQKGSGKNITVTKSDTLFHLKCNNINEDSVNISINPNKTVEPSSGPPSSVAGIVGKVDMVLQELTHLSSYKAEQNLPQHLEIGQTNIKLIIRHHKPTQAWAQSYVLLPVTCTATSLSESSIKYKFWDLMRPKGSFKDADILGRFEAEVTSGEWEMTAADFYPFEFAQKPGGRIELECRVLICPGDKRGAWKVDEDSSTPDGLKTCQKAYTSLKAFGGKFSASSGSTSQPATSGNLRQRRAAVKGRQLVHTAVVRTTFLAREPVYVDSLSGASLTSWTFASVLVALTTLLQMI